LIDYGAIRFHHKVDEQGFLSTEHLHTLQTACKQRRDYDLDLFTIVISVAYLETIAALEKELQQCKANPHADGSLTILLS
jgi:hypothetical protein